jgi:hypothetical protein
MALSKPASKSFRAPIMAVAGKLKWTGVRIPFDAARLWGKRGMIRVKGEMNGFGFGATLFPNGSGGHFLLVTKKMLRGGSATVGSVASFRLEPDRAPRPIVVPKELERMFAQSKAMRRFYDGMSETLRRFFANQVAGRKSPASRVRRAEQIAEQILETIEAERELPPQILLAMRDTPGAWAGWKKMTPRARRQQLLAVFYYRSPESRARRLARAIEMMVAQSDKR